MLNLQWVYQMLWSNVEKYRNSWGVVSEIQTGDFRPGGAIGSALKTGLSGIQV